MKKTKIFLVATGTFLIFTLSGCVSREEIFQEYKEKCRSFGFTEGTTPFSECMEKQDIEQQRDSAIILSSPSMNPGWGPGWGGGWGGGW